MAIVDQSLEFQTHTFTAQGAATVDSGVQRGMGSLGIRVVVNISAVGGTPTLDVKMMGVDPISGNAYDVQGQAATCSLTQITGTGTFEMTIFPGTIETAGRRHSASLPTQYIIRAVIAGTTPSFTGTISVQKLG